MWISFANLKCAELIDWNVFRDAYEASQDFLASFEKFIELLDEFFDVLETGRYSEEAVIKSGKLEKEALSYLEEEV